MYSLSGERPALNTSAVAPSSSLSLFLPVNPRFPQIMGPYVEDSARNQCPIIYLNRSGFPLLLRQIKMFLNTFRRVRRCAVRRSIVLYRKRQPQLQSVIVLMDSSRTTRQLAFENVTKRQFMQLTRIIELHISSCSRSWWKDCPLPVDILSVRYQDECTFFSSSFNYATSERFFLK